MLSTLESSSVLFRFLLALLALSLASPVKADITLRYSQAQGGSPITVQVNSEGRVRMDVTGAYYLYFDDVSYIVMSDARGTFVARQSDFVDLLNRLPMAPAPAGTSSVAITERGTEVVAGRTGVVFAVRGRGTTADEIVVVVSDDVDLAPVSRAMQAIFPPFFASVGGSVVGLADALNSVLRRGAPLRLGTIFQLESIEHQPVAASAFALPAQPLSPEALAARLGIAPER